MSDEEWEKIKARATASGETVSAFLLRRALEDQDEDRLREALLKVGAMGFEIMTLSGAALKKRRKRRILNRPLD